MSNCCSMSSSQHSWLRMQTHTDMPIQTWQEHWRLFSVSWGTFFSCDHFSPKGNRVQQSTSGKASHIFPAIQLVQSSEMPCLPLGRYSWSLLKSQKKNKIKLRWALFVTYTIIQRITGSEMCSLHLTHPSAHTLGAVGSRHCSTRGAVGGSVPCSRVSPQSWTIPAGAEIRTNNLGLHVQRFIH